MNNTISLCMIVKNEEHNLQKFFQNIPGVIDEIIVVDTGSADRSSDIALSSGAKLYNFQWTNNFSEARNFALSKASYKWILSLDADEIIASCDHVKLEELVKKPSADNIAFQFELRNYVNYPNTKGWIPNDGKYKSEEAGTGWFPDEVRAVKLFPNRNNVHFVHAIYEDIIPSLLQLGIKIRKTSIAIHHYGYLTEEQADTKFERYFEIKTLEISQKSNEDLSDLYQQAQHLMILGKYKEALEYWQKIVSFNPNFLDAGYCLGLTLFHLKQFNNALTLMKHAVKQGSDSRDTVVLYSQSEICAGNVQACIQPLERIIREDPKYILAIYPLAIAYFLTGRKDKAMEYVNKLREMDFSCTLYFSEFAKLLVSAGRIDYAILLLNILIESNNANKDTLDQLSKCYQIQQQMKKCF
jgi:glycosyltransferase involved in cell wall biosynthesis